MIERITQQLVETAPKPGRNERALYSDPDLRGFYLIVTPTRRSFYAQSLSDGRQVRIKVGEHPAMTADEAREAVAKALSDMRAGALQPTPAALPITPPLIAPQKMMPAAPTVAEDQEPSPTLRDALDLHLKSRRLSQRTRDDYRYSIETYLKDWLDRPLDSIGRDRRGVRERHALLTEKNGLATADSVMRVLRALYNRAAREHLALPRNPTENVDFHGTRRRSTKLVHPGALAKWAKAVAAIENPVRADLQRFVLLSAMRRTAAIEMRWEHVDLEAGTVFVPNPKGGKDRAFTLVLSDAMCDLLERRKAATRPECPWVWPAQSESGHVASTSEKSDAIVNLHQLRATYISMATRTGVDHYTLKLLVNHSRAGDVTLGYITSSFDHLKPAQERVTAQIAEAAGGMAALMGISEGEQRVAAPSCEESSRVASRPTRLDR